eukprot:TRINITY_DN1649_c0_g1_i2.p1 TRINITY_DN1649_c0_g1~~TRINITY_DN1649_c0_g1_i2.p1  ORF type:complete len:123 (-),score=9.10 TRINITY_DN1649_c0_g1_i2:580-948(-)
MGSLALPSRPDISHLLMMQMTEICPHNALTSPSCISKQKSVLSFLLREKLQGVIVFISRTLAMLIVDMHFRSNWIIHCVYYVILKGMRKCRQSAFYYRHITSIMKLIIGIRSKLWHQAYENE